MRQNRFTAAEAEEAWQQWGCNCGPTAIAAIMGLTLDDVHRHLSEFDRRGYTSPTMMQDALASIGKSWRMIGHHWPEHGLVRIQWEGPWTKPGVPMAARYRHTHWIATMRSAAGRGVFDVNAMANGSGWCSFADWQRSIVPFIVGSIRQASGAWSITHGVEVKQQAAARVLAAGAALQ